VTYDHPHHDTSQRSRGGSGLAITALVLGVLALVTSWTIIGGVLLGLGAIIVGLIALTRIRQGRGQGRAMAVIGIVTAVIGLLVAIGVIVLGASFLNSDTGQKLRDCLEQAGNDETAQAQCERDFEDDLRN
jgi:O-antigen ligase